MLEDRLLRLARFFLLDRFVHGVVLAAPLRADSVVLHERPSDRPGDLDHFLLQERRRAQRGAPRPLVGQLPEEAHDRRHLGYGDDTIVRVPRVAQVVADPTEELVVIGGRADLTAQEAEVLDQKVARAVLANLEILAARVNAAEDPRKPGDQQIVLGDVSPHLLAAQGAGGEALEILGAPERILCEELGGQRVEPFFGRHGAPSQPGIGWLGL